MLRFSRAWAAGAGGAGEAAGGGGSAGCLTSVRQAAARAVPGDLEKLFTAGLHSRRGSVLVEHNRRAAEVSAGAQLGQCCWAEVAGLPHADVGAAAKAVLQYSRPSGPPPLVTLYGPLGAECLHEEFGSWLEQAAGDGLLHYKVRPVAHWRCGGTPAACPAGATLGGGGLPKEDTHLWLPGYGVALVVKSTEYRASDDGAPAHSAAGNRADTAEAELQHVSGIDFASLVTQKPDLREHFVALQAELLHDVGDPTRAHRPLEKWQLQDLGLQVALKVAAAQHPLATLSHISQNFPALERPVSMVEVPADAHIEFTSQRKLLPAGRSRLWLNGALLELEDLHLHSLIDRAQKEHEILRLIASLTDAPLSEVSRVRAQIAQGLFHPRQRIDIRKGSPAVHYSSDQTKDPGYNSKSEFNVGKSRKNLYSAVFVMDPTIPGAVASTAVEMQRISGMGTNARAGLVFARPEAGSDGERFMQGFLLLKRAGGAKAAFEFFHAVSDVLRRRDSEDLSWKACERALKDSYLLHTDPRRRPRGMGNAKWAVDAINGVNGWVGEGLRTEMEAASTFISERGLQHGDFLSNGVVLRGSLIDGRGWSSAKIIGALHEDYDHFRTGLADGSFQDDESGVPEFIFRAASLKFSPHLIPGEGIAGGVPALAQPGDGVWEAVQDTGYMFSSQESIPEVTMWVFFDGSSSEGLALLNASVDFALSGKIRPMRTRIALLSSGVSESALTSMLRILPSLDLEEESRGRFIARVIKEVGTETKLCEDLRCSRESLLGSPLMAVAGEFGISETLSKRLVEAGRHAPGVSDLSLTFRDYLTAKSPRLGSNAVVVNGWAVASLPDVVAGDIAALVAHASHALAGAQIARLTRPERVLPRSLHEGLQPADRALLLASVLTETAHAVAPVNHEWKHVQEALANCRHTCSRKHAAQGESNLVAVLNPIGPETPRISALIEALPKFFDVGVTLLMNPPDRVKQPPLQSFYRYVLPELGGVEASGHLPPPLALFDNLRGSHMVSLHMDVPEAWELLPTEANMDLYNMKLSDMDMAARSVFKLQFLLITGNVWTVPRGEGEGEAEQDPDAHHPPGVILEVRERRAGGSGNVQKVLAMGNRGYFQVKVLPGMYSVAFSPGCTRSLYSLHVPGQGGDSLQDNAEAAAASLPFAAATLSGLSLQISGAPVSKFQNVSECDAASEAPGSFSLGSWFTHKIDRLLPRRGSDRDTVHIFSLASGHMYERLLRIMILSVTKNTRRPVKFWFLKSYASPDFAVLLGAMAAEYKFDYEFVSYKWPSWLFRQGDQQRLMWAYKILFLDVLFPKEVQRITFVDADQVIRADVGELHDMDLEGAPYAYTPFCNDYAPMEGFRFWREGFWAEHLAGKPYHISALYVVDLTRFRRTGAGDTLRNLYNKLAPDGKSLSNLDQDLPNYAQFAVPIFSLPQDWLYCETWCGPAAIETAKAIDLCNNPATRESKLDGARRIIAEWATLDDEQRAFSKPHLQAAGRPQAPRSEL